MNEGLIAISGYSYQDSSVEVELFANGNWYDQPPFPEEKAFYYYSMASYVNLLYVFGKFLERIILDQIFQTTTVKVDMIAIIKQ